MLSEYTVVTNEPLWGSGYVDQRRSDGALMFFRTWTSVICWRWNPTVEELQSDTYKADFSPSIKARMEGI